MADSPRIEELKRRVQADPASIAFAALAEEYRRAGRFDEAIETCTTGLVRHPSYLSAHVTLGRALIEVGRLQEARTELEYVLKLAPENLAAIRGLAEIHHRIGVEHADHVEHVVEPTQSEPPSPAAIEKPEPEPTPVPRIALKMRVDEKAEGQPSNVTTDGGDKPEPPAPLPVAASQPEHRLQPPAPNPLLATIAVRTVETSSPTEPRMVSPLPVDPALAGLEEFLNAIVRARSQRASVR